jgi:hypothetical protein
MPSGDSTCKYCGDPIRWVDDEGRRLAVSIAPVDGGSYRVVGHSTARRIKKEDRAKFGKLYKPHRCQQWKDAKAIIEREKADRAAQASQQPFPPNVVPYRNPEIVPPSRRRR